MDQSDDLLRRARGGIELLRPHPHRGDLIAAGAVPLTVALLLIDVRLDETWGAGIFLVLEALGAALLLAMGVLAPMEGDRPRAYQTVLHLTGLTLLLLALLRLADVLGADSPLDSAGNVFWTFGVTAAVAVWLARERRGAICVLVGAVAGTVSALAFVDWVFDPSGEGTSRWILLLAALGLLAGALVLRDRRRRESVYLIDAAGLAILLLGLTWLLQAAFGLVAFGDGGPFAAQGPGAGWKVVLLAAGLGLVAYAGVDREPGPAYLGVLILLVFVLLVGAPGEGGPSLWFWPAVLLLVGAAMIGAGLRPRQPLPPEPGRFGPPAEPVPGPFAGGAGDEAAREAPAGEAGTAEPARRSPEEPPARGALWARADPGEQPTRQQPAVRPDDDAPTQVKPPGDRG